MRDTTIDIQSLIDDAIARGGGVVDLPKGTYRLPTRLHFRDAQNVVLNGHGSTLVFTERADGGVYLTDSRGVELRELSIDFDPVPFTQGEIVAMDPTGAWYDIRIDAGYTTDPGVFQENRAMKVFDAATRRFKVDGRLVFPSSLASPADGMFRAAFDDPAADFNNLRAGDFVAITSDRPSHAMFLNEAESCVVDGVTVLGSPGTGILEVGGGGNRFRYTITPGPKPSGASADRLLSSCADGLWSAGARRGAQLDGCLMEFVGDTGVNIHGTYREVTEVDGNAVRFKRVAGGIYLKAGDRLYAYCSRTYRKKADTTIESVEGDLLQLADPAGIEPGDYIISPDRVGRRAIIKNSTFRDIECEAVLMRASDVLIENNVIERQTFTGIYLGPEVGVYVEPDFVHNITVRGNILHQIGTGRWSRAQSAVYLGAISVGVLVPFGAPAADSKAYADVFEGLRPNSSIVIEDNTVDECAVFGLFISSTSGVEVTGNHFSRTNAYDPLDAGRIFGIAPSSAIYVRDSDHVTFADNTVADLGPYADTPIVLDPSADADTIDVTGLTFEP
jgi:hypothetical protein